MRAAMSYRSAQALAARRVAAGALLAALAAGTLAATAPGELSATRPLLSTDPVHVLPGGKLLLRGRHFPPGIHLRLTARRLRGPGERLRARIGSARPGRLGGFAAPIDIERGAKPGLYLVVACADHCRVRASVRFRVLRP